ncbi:MAG: ABC-F family ATP-binding cassette domain-containing protein, partial [Lachnospiraceae bacterium]|nr:ABC-F family ATP-binding cassette domain-containing protein [Lachnospiraceae bacterium]
SRGLQSGNDVLNVRGLSFAYPSASKTLLRELNFQVKRGEKVFIVGPNGCGKSTLIKLLLGDLDCTGGVIDYGHNLQIGYYDQENQGLETATPFSRSFGRSTPI